METKSKLTTLCYIEKDEKYLMLHRVLKKNDINKDKWIGVGGHFEKGESPEDCLLREVKEETGLTLTSYQFRVSELLENLAVSSLPTLESYNVSLVLNIEPNLPVIQADKTKMSQLILNLLRNSSEAIKTEGIIHCSLTSQENYLVLSVKDNGSGIPVLYQEDLFEPFITHKQEGTGLGLPICKRIAEAHNGNISFQSVPEKGTEFTVLLPIRQPL